MNEETVLIGPIGFCPPCSRRIQKGGPPNRSSVIDWADRVRPNPTKEKAHSSGGPTGFLRGLRVGRARQG